MKIYSTFTLIYLCFFLAFTLDGQEIHLNKFNNEVQEYHPIKKSQKHKIRFKENKGQVKDQYWNPRTDILFYSQENGLQLFLKKNGFHYQLSQVQSWKTPDYEPESKLKTPDKIRTYRIDVQWLGINPYTKVSSFQPYPDMDNYYNVAHGMPPALGVKSYHSVKYEQIYKGIDLEFHGKNGYLEYDFIVQPGADYKQIQIKIEGAQVQTTKSGELIFKTPLGDIHEGALKVYQNHQLIASNWVLKDNVLSLDIPCYDKTKPLIIDPPIRVWGTYYGGEDLDRIWQATMIGNVLYFCGETQSTNNIATVGTFDQTYDANNDIMIIAFHKDGYRIWGTYAGGLDFDAALGISKGENSNSIYVVGYTRSSTGIANTSGVHQSIKSADSDGFILKMNTSNGTRVWGTYYGGMGSDILARCVVDQSNNRVYVVGRTNSTSGISTLSVFQFTKDAGFDIFFSGFSISGNQLWGSYFGGSGFDAASGISVDNNGDIYISGWTSGSTGLATTHQTTPGGNDDGIIAKFNSSGTIRLWASYYGGDDDDIVSGIQYNPIDNHVYVVGYTESDDNISTSGTHQSARSGHNDYFLSKFTLGGSRVWGTYFGGPDEEQTHSYYSDIAFHNSFIYIHGSTASTTGIATSDAYQTTLSSDYDAFWAVFNNTNGTLASASYYGSDDFDLSCSLILNNCELFLFGNTSSSSNISSSGAYDTQMDGSEDGFIVCFIPEEPIILSQSVCKGHSITFNISGSGTYHWYTTPVGGTPFHTGSSYTTPALQQTEVYYVEAVTHGCVSQKRTPVYAYVNNPVSTITSSSNHTSCVNNGTTLLSNNRVIVWQENFNDLTRAQASWILNEYGRKYLPSSNPVIANFSTPTSNRWVINSQFAPYSPSADGGNYLHIARVDSLWMETNLSRGARNLTAVMNYDIPGNLINGINPKLEFQIIGAGGSSQTFVKLIYSVNGGAWQEYSTDYVNINSWFNANIDLSSLTGWTPGASLRLGFRFYDLSSASIQNPAFGIDNLRITVDVESYTWYDGPSVVGTSASYSVSALTTDKNYGLSVNACGCNGDINRYSIYIGYHPPTTTFGGNVCLGNSASIPVSSPNKVLKVYDFAEGLSGWTIQNGQDLIPSSTPSNGSQPNQWTVNTNYLPLTPSSQGGNYLHITSNGQQAMTFQSGTQHFTNTAIRLSSPITGLTASNYQLRFDWIGEGANDAYAVLIYKVGSGNWQEYPYVFNNNNTWQTFTINLNTLGWLSGQSFNFGFRWRNENISGNSSFGVDNIQLIILNHPYRWYYNPIGGSPFHTGATYNTPPLFSNVTYYVEAGASGTCPSSRTPITVNVIDTEPVVSEEYLVCYGGSTTINITGPIGATFDWYTDETGGIKFHTGNSYTTPAIYANTDYYIETINSGCTSSVRKKVTVYVNDYITPEVDDDYFEFCPGDGFGVTCNFPTTGIIRWYDAPSGGNLLHTGSSYSESNVYSFKQIYVESYIAGCPSMRKQITIAPSTDPIPFASDVTICEGQSATLDATGTWNTIGFGWYDAPTGGTNLGSGSSYTTPPLTASTTYYIEGYSSESCTSTSRYAVTVYVVPNFTISGPTTVHQNSVEKYQLSTSIPGCIWSFDDPSAAVIEYNDDDEATIRFEETFSGTVTISVYDPTYTCYSEITVIVNPTLKLKLKASLQGAKSTLNDGTMVQTSQNHYNLKLVYGNAGNLALSPYPFISSIAGGKLKLGFKVPDDAVDVVQIELRNTTNPSIVEATAYGWLLYNGDIVDYECAQSILYGTTIPYVNFKNIISPSYNYHIVVKHRNHLPIRTQNPQSVGYTVPTSTLNLVNPANVYNPYGNFVYLDVNNHAYMLMGNVYDDLNDKGEVNATDFYIVSTQNDNNPTGYYIEDLNLDGQVDAVDFNMIQQANNSLYFTNIPLPYLDTTW